ncbi:MAG: HAD-IIIA family hydrolase [Bacteroidales bacterium]|nr:HAD-IIIA family hydrolase [Bacteroidales bacterium]MBK7173576.1 HAD-IIIA family hydrolase [Bacteroidales bacterium]
MSNYKERLLKINTFIFDYDGVLTDGTVILMSNGEALRTANVKDGYALQLAMKKGYRIAIISGAYSESVKKRFESLRVSDVFLGVERKIEVFEEYLAEHGLSTEEVLFMGDDIPDYEIMRKVGVPTCPSDAAEEIKALATYISHHNGGHGCVRDVIEQVLKVQGQWMNEDAYHW